MVRLAHVNILLIHARSVYLRNFAIMVAVESAESATSVARRFSFCTQCSRTSMSCVTRACEHSDPNTAHVTQIGGSEVK